MDTLAFGCILPTTGRIPDFHRLETCAAELTKKRQHPRGLGMLLYTRTDEELISDCDYRMSGSRISVKTLDLNQEFPKIREKLDRIGRLVSP